MLGTAFLFLIFLIVSILEGGSRGGSSGYSSGGEYTKPTSSNSTSNQELKKEAQFQARQKRKEADHALKYAGKQARYNINTHHFDSRLNYAKEKQREAIEAEKKSKNV